MNILDSLIPEPGSIYVMDRAYIDYERLHVLNLAKAFFVIRAKSNFQFRRLYSHSVDKSTGLRCDQTVSLTGFYSSHRYPDKLRRLKFYDADEEKSLVFLSNHFDLPPLSVCELYKLRWQVEIFFKWIKQNLRIKSFYGNSPNAVKTQIWIAITVYVLVAIVKKRLNLNISLYTFLQILSLTMFEKIPILQLVTENDLSRFEYQNTRQLFLFDI